MKLYGLYGYLLAVLMLTSCSVTQRIDEDFRTETYNHRMLQFAENPLKNRQIVFFGNSITQAGKWDVYFSDVNPANRGISGDNTEGMLARIDEIIKSKPSKFFKMAGINDISLSRDDKEIIRNYRAILQKLKVGSSGTKIYVQSVLPINNDFSVYSRLTGKEKRVVSLNKKLKILAKREKVDYIDLYSSFIDSDKKLKKEFTNDGLHLNDNAYTLWVQLIKKYVIQ